MGLLYRQRTRSLKDLSNKLLEAIAIENQLKSQTMIQGCKFPAKKGRTYINHSVERYKRYFIWVLFLSAYIIFAQRWLLLAKDWSGNVKMFLFSKRNLSLQFSEERGDAGTNELAIFLFFSLQYTRKFEVLSCKSRFSLDKKYSWLQIQGFAQREVASLLWFYFQCIFGLVLTAILLWTAGNKSYPHVCFCAQHDFVRLQSSVGYCNKISKM